MNLMPFMRLAFIFMLATAYAIPAWALPSFAEVKADFRPSDTLVLDRNGETLHRLRADATVRRGQWVALEDVSPALRTALVLSEDKRFYDHSGVDWQAASAAAWGNLWNRRTRGASTITMQLAGLLDGDWRAGSGGRSVAQKLGQTVAAQVLERRWRKDQILEAYLNLLPFRGELVGIDALSRTLFNKAALGLDAREAAVAAALVRAPNSKVAQVVQRACAVEKAIAVTSSPLSSQAAVDCTGLDLFATVALQRRAFVTDEGIAPHLARRLVTQWRTSKLSSALPSTLSSTLSAPLQRFALQTLQRQLRELKGRNVEDGAVLVLDNASGEVLAWVGSSGTLSQAAQVDAVTAPRQAGSTLKPFLYAQAIAEQRLTAASLLNDAATQIPTASGLYIPQNYDHQFKGWVSVRTALAASLNVPAVRTLVLVTPDALHRQLRAVGLPLKETGDYFGYSLALGSPEVTLLALSNAYRTLSNGGRYSPVVYQNPTGRSNPTASSKFTLALDPRAAFIVSDILSDTNARARTFGTDSVLATRFWTAVKTGTSKDMRDNWAVGYSQRYTVGVWVGNASGAAMHDVSGTTGAAPVWAAVMQHLHNKTPSVAPTPPAGLSAVHTQFENQTEASRTEWFLAGTEQHQIAINSVAAIAYPVSAKAEKSYTAKDSHITSPSPGTILALDPDIPPTRQRVQFASVGAQATSRWSVDSKVMAQGPQAQWLPWPGKHVIRLTSAQGVVLDEVRIEVRGAGVK